MYDVINGREHVAKHSQMRRKTFGRNMEPGNTKMAVLYVSTCGLRERAKFLQPSATNST